MTGILVDTSVWVNHFRVRNQMLIDLLERDAVMMHPMVVAEIACGTPPLRAKTLSDLASLQQSQHTSLREVMALIEREKLFGEGCGVVDMILLSSTLITPGAKLWRLDKRLAVLADKLGVLYCENFH